MKKKKLKKVTNFVLIQSNFPQTAINKKQMRNKQKNLT